MLLVRSTSSLKEIAGFACPIALSLRMHHKTCALLALISDSVSFVTLFFRRFLESGDCCVGVTGCFTDKPVVCKSEGPPYAIVLLRSASPFVLSL